MVKDMRRGRRRGAESGGGGRTRGRGAADEREAADLAVEINDLEKEPRQAIRTNSTDAAEEDSQLLRFGNTEKGFVFAEGFWEATGKG